MIKWHQIPFCRIAMPFVAGIWVGIEYPLVNEGLPWVLVLLAVGILSTYFLLKILKKWWGVAVGVQAFAWLFVAGIYVVGLNTVFFRANHLTKVPQNYQCYVAKVVSEPLAKQKTVKCELEMERVVVGGQTIEVCGKIIAYFKRDSISEKLQYGHVLLIKGTPQAIQHPLNPHEFNLKRYYGFHQISHRQFISTNQFVMLAQGKGNKLFEWSYNLRKIALQHFEMYLPTLRECQVATALVLGIKTDIDTDLKEAYSAAGAMHVLAVSGLHVGLIYTILHWLTLFITKIKNGIIVQSLLLITLLWGYALVTGLSPSVLRAVTMLSFILLSKVLNRKNQTFNSLFATVFLLLLVNPYMLMEVGFQLSFLAVFGILYLYPRVYGLISINNKLLDSIWGITVMSVVAQIATAPVSLLYFHQFPVYFIFSNWIVIPAATLIMYVGLFFTALAWWPMPSLFIGKALYYMVYTLNEGMLLVEKLPYSTLSGISITIFETWLIYTLMAFFVLGIVGKKMIFFINASIISVMLGCVGGLKTYRYLTQKECIVYHINGGYAIDEFNGDKCYTYIDSATAQNHSKVLFHILNHRWASGVKNPVRHPAFQKFDWGAVGLLNGKKVLHLTSFKGVPNRVWTMNFDVIIFSYDSYKWIYKHFKAANIMLIDGSTPNYAVKNLQNKYSHLHFTMLHGAYQL